MQAIVFWLSDCTPEAPGMARDGVIPRPLRAMTSSIENGRSAPGGYMKGGASNSRKKPYSTLKPLKTSLLTSTQRNSKMASMEQKNE